MYHVCVCIYVQVHEKVKGTKVRKGVRCENCCFLSSNFVMNSYTAHNILIYSVLSDDLCFRCCDIQVTFFEQETDGLEFDFLFNFLFVFSSIS